MLLHFKVTLDQFVMSSFSAMFALLILSWKDGLMEQLLTWRNLRPIKASRAIWDHLKKHKRCCFTSDQVQSVTCCQAIPSLCIHRVDSHPYYSIQKENSHTARQCLGAVRTRVPIEYKVDQVWVSLNKHQHFQSAIQSCTWHAHAAPF
jgi:hypothetical protein